MTRNNDSRMKDTSTMVALGALAVATAALVVPSMVKRREDAPSMNGSRPKKPSESGHEAINGVNYYYEIHGHGDPLVLFHGALGSMEMFGPVRSMLAREREVISVDLHGHGRTALGERAINVNEMADDLAVLMDRLDVDRADAIGYSLGADVAFRLAVQHPARVRRLVLVSSAFSREGFHPEINAMREQMNAAMADSMRHTPMYLSYAAIAPDPGEFPILLDRVGEWMRIPYDWEDDVSKLAMPAMLVYGDSDAIRPDHIAKFYRLLGGGMRDAGWAREYMSPNRLAILPGRTHYDIFFAPELARTALPFLEGETSTRNWTDMVEELE
ncbi:MAG TPA: alpha/beta hydrolase [Candidatus Krumholzibacteria bacterium]